MKKWTIIKSHLVTGVPEFLLGETYDDVEASMQELADEASRRNPKRPFGVLSFKHIYGEGYARGVHSFFSDKSGRWRRFIKAEEESSLHPRHRLYNVITAFQRFSGQPMAVLEGQRAIDISELDSIEETLRKLAEYYASAGRGNPNSDMTQLSAAMLTDLRRGHC